MLASLVAAWGLPELRQKIIFLFMMFGVFIFGLHVPVPGVDHAKMDQLFMQGGAFGLLDIFSGGALRKFTIFAMGIAPYINASIIMQLLVVGIPQWQQLQEEGSSGRKVIARYTRYLTLALALVQAIGMTTLLRRQDILEAGGFSLVIIIITLVGGTAFLMWLGGLITENGLGNGISLLIFISIMATLPYEVGRILQLASQGAIGWTSVFLLSFFWIVTIAAIVFITEGQRKVPIQHMKRTVGGRTYGGGGSFLPLRVNSAGVIPIIFAMSLLFLPVTASQFLPAGTLGSRIATGLVTWLTPAPTLPGLFASLVYTMFIVFFTYFYTMVTVDVAKMTENFKKWGTFIPGVRPGKPTQQYLDQIVTRLTLAGALFLSAVALLQYFIPYLTGIPGGTFSLYGGTSLLIVVGVALETMNNLEAQLMMRNYEGFIR
ncbi:MAG: preprotein translocase subunit SecY [Armatimonadetes bacterium]|nr:preprotein translocase subunit SecY [Armatimonadota bacterium]